MRRPAPLRPLVLLLVATTLTACVPPREQVQGRSADGRTALELELQPSAEDSVLGTGTLRVAGHPRAVRVRGHWSDQGDGVRHLAATLQADTTPSERWALSWSPGSLEGSIRSAAADRREPEVALAAR
jgi:hypothetical protein